MYRICYKAFELVVTNIEVIKTATSFLALKALNNYLHSSFFY